MPCEAKIDLNSDKMPWAEPIRPMSGSEDQRP